MPGGAAASLQRRAPCVGAPPLRDPARPPRQGEAGAVADGWWRALDSPAGAAGSLVAHRWAQCSPSAWTWRWRAKLWWTCTRRAFGDLAVDAAAGLLGLPWARHAVSTPTGSVPASAVRTPTGSVPAHHRECASARGVGTDESS